MPWVWHHAINSLKSQAWNVYFELLYVWLVIGVLRWVGGGGSLKNNPPLQGVPEPKKLENPWTTDYWGVHVSGTHQAEHFGDDGARGWKLRRTTRWIHVARQRYFLKPSARFLMLEPKNLSSIKQPLQNVFFAVLLPPTPSLKYVKSEIRSTNFGFWPEAC